jgi:hypothetical protein
MYDFYWNFLQERRLNDLASDARRESTSTLLRTESTNDRIDALLLMNMAMWSILQDKLGVPDEQLMRRVQEIDLRDGKLDGKPPAIAVRCTKCGREQSPRHKKCLYCGGEVSKPSPFAGI